MGYDLMCPVCDRPCGITDDGDVPEGVSFETDCDHCETQLLVSAVVSKDEDGLGVQLTVGVAF
jgi:hypothetical protein